MRETVIQAAESDADSLFKADFVIREFRRSTFRNPYLGERLLPLWDAAYRLHTYADQTPDRATLDRDWRLAAQFIAGMLSILLTDTAPDAPDG